METSPLFDGIREKWIDQGIQQGIQKGIQQGIQDTILDALEENIGRYPESLVNSLRAIRDIDMLKMLHRKAVKAKTIDEFVQALNEAMRKNN